MEWLEANEIPEECKNCVQEDCYNCDVAGERWVLFRQDELRVSRKLMEKAAKRWQRKIAEIDVL